MSPGKKGTAKTGHVHGRPKSSSKHAKAAGDAKSLAALRRFAQVGAQASADLSQPDALKALLPQLGRVAAGLVSAYGSTSG